MAGSSQEEYIFFGGTRVARRDVSGDVVHYYFSDHLGSHGVVENATGSSCEQDIDYYPFGAVSNDYCPSVTQHYRFTGKERDSESGLDMFGARYYGSSLGRFMTPDWAAKPTAVPYAMFGDPQSLNLYRGLARIHLRLYLPGIGRVAHVCAASEWAAPRFAMFEAWVSLPPIRPPLR